ncbi:MAG: hypothetical protein JNG83_13465 [Opitutaceae bacterium]|nr:hypothetical protein [Opitutaceae bacterium]
MRPLLPAPRRLLGPGLAAAWLCLGTGCVTGWRAKADLYDAYYQYQIGDNAAALAKIRQALDSCSWPGVPDQVVIEAYDDAGLYYYLNRQPRAAFVHQAVAVLVSEAAATPAPLRETYLGRLLKALAASDIGLSADTIREDPRVLLTVPEVRDHPQVRRRYGGPARP